MDKHILRAPDDADAGGGETKTDSGEQSAEAKAAAVADIMGATLDGEAIPQKFRGKTVADLFTSYKNLEQRLSKEREAAKAKAPAPAPAKESVDEEDIGPLIDLSQVLQSGVTEGKIDDNLAQQIASQTNLSAEDLQEMASLMHQKRMAVIGNAAAILSQERETEIDGIGLVQAAIDSGLFSDQELAEFDTFMRRHPKSIEPFRIIADRMEEAGFVLAQLTVDNPLKTNKRQPLGVPLAKGNTAAIAADRAGFGSRKEYLASLRSAGNDPEKRAEVDRRLKMSKISKWPDRDEGY